MAHNCCVSKGCQCILTFAFIQKTAYFWGSKQASFLR